MAYFWRFSYRLGVFLRKFRPDDYNHWHPVRIAELEIGDSCYLAFWIRGEMESIGARLPESLYECAVVHRGWYLDIPDSLILWSLTLHHHYWHSLWEDALPTGKIGVITIRKRGCII